MSCKSGVHNLLTVKSRIRSVLARQELERMLNREAGKVATAVRRAVLSTNCKVVVINPYPTAFPYGNGRVLHFYQQQESSTTKTVHKVINKGLKAYV